MNTSKNDSPILQYANSMFRYDYINRQWVSSCARYLRELFGERLMGAVVLDYGFGRGNWAAAMLEAGASKVIAIDGSEENCRRLQNWVKGESITGLEVVHGNVLDAPIACRADIVWAHGILHHIEQPAQLLRALREMAPGPNALFHVYAYDYGSLRQAIVELARRSVCYATEEEFRRDAPLFAQRTRIRVRDDLTAPVIHWLSMAELDAMARELELAVVRRHTDYSEWLRGSVDEEFQPHNVLLSPCGPAARPEPLAEPKRHHAGDVRLLAAVAKPLFDVRCVDAEQARRHAIGLCNTHFEAVADGGIALALKQDLLQVLYLLYAGGLENAVYDEPARQLLELADSALSGRERKSLAVPANSHFIVPYLQSHGIRL